MKFIFLIVCVVVFFMCSDSMHADRKKKRIDKERIAFEDKLNTSDGSIKKETIKETRRRFAPHFTLKNRR